MNNELPPTKANQLRRKVHKGAKMLLRGVCLLQNNIASGLSQANSGEKGLRAMALQDTKIDQQIDTLNLNPVSDHVPPEWTNGQQD